LHRSPGPPLPPSAAAGSAFAIAAYTIWGLAPAYWKQVAEIPAAELTAWRALAAAALAVVMILASGRGREFVQTLADPRRSLAIALSALLIASNWLVFIYAVQTERVAHTSLGYYVNPLVSVALGLVVLRERLRPAQWGAVAVAAAGVGWWALRLGGLPWIACTLAITFALYGLVRKLAPVTPLVGFALEMGLLAPLAAAWLATRPEPGPALPGAGLSLQLWVSAAAFVTAAPLICFASAARRLPLAVLGLFQYIAPSLALLLAVAWLGEPFTGHHAISFGCVAAALAIFSADSLREALRSRAARSSGSVVA
jgi:chloramphenicol-sensitive protein RarD